MRKMKIEKKILLPKTVQKYLSSVISGIKSQTRAFHASAAITISHGRKRPKSLPISTAGHFFALRRLRRHNHQTTADSVHKCSSATLGDIDRFLSENFRSLYGDNEEEDDRVADFDDAPSLFEIPAPEITDLCGSNRFFFTPVCSGSLIEEARAQSEEAGFEDSIGGFAEEMMNNEFDDCAAVVTASGCPYEDFLRSMEEVMKARGGDGRRIDWDFMEELLFCYLRLNEEQHYRFVLRAFVDLVVDLRQSAGGGGGDRCGGGLVVAERRGEKIRLRDFVLN